MKIEKKVQSEYFEKILSGVKKYELRLADFEINENDILVLKEVDSNTGEYTGRQIEKKVTMILKTKDLDFWKEEDIKKHGYQIISFL